MLGLTLAASARDLHEVCHPFCVLCPYVCSIKVCIVDPFNNPLPGRPHLQTPTNPHQQVLHEELLDCSFVNSLNPWGAFTNPNINACVTCVCLHSDGDLSAFADIAPTQPTDIVTSVSYVKELQEDVTADLECLLIRTIGPSWS